MKRQVSPYSVFSSRQISAEIWPDFEQMFARHNGCHGGCWCVYHILSSGEFNRTDGAAHKARHRESIISNETSGVVCYLDDIPVGWCQFGPAGSFNQINRGKAYRLFQESDHATPVWRITCVFVDKDWRGNGLARMVLHEAVLTIKAMGGGLTEAFPMEIPGAKRPQYTGSVDMYAQEGFEIVAPLGQTNFLMRSVL